MGDFLLIVLWKSRKKYFYVFFTNTEHSRMCVCVCVWGGGVIYVTSFTGRHFGHISHFTKKELNCLFLQPDINMVQL